MWDSKRDVNYTRNHRDNLKIFMSFKSSYVHFDHLQKVIVTILSVLA